MDTRDNDDILTLILSSSQREVLVTFRGHRIFFQLRTNPTLNSLNGTKSFQEKAQASTCCSQPNTATTNKKLLLSHNTGSFDNAVEAKHINLVHCQEEKQLRAARIRTLLTTSLVILSDFPPSYGSEMDVKFRSCFCFATFIQSMRSRTHSQDWLFINENSASAGN